MENQENVARDSIKAKISKLLNMTEENGASENEALIAAQRAAKLMTDHDINMSELVMKNSKSIKGTNSFRKYGTTRLGQLFAVPLSSFCDCKVWIDTGSDQLVYFGLPNDVQIASYLFDMLANTVEIEIRKFKNSSSYRISQANGSNGKTLVSSFILGIEQRIAGKLRELTALKKQTVNAATGSALVILKDQIVNKDFAELGIRPKKNTSSRTVRSNAAFEAGSAAGNNVHIVSGISGSREKQIG